MLNKKIIEIFEAGKNIYQCTRCKTNIASFQKPVLCLCGHKELIQIDRKSIEDNMTIIIEDSQGTIIDVKNLPKGWKYLIKKYK